MRDRFPLTKKHIGRVVGSGGQQISQLRTDFDVDIEISASNESKESEEMISLVGLEDNISRCKAKIEDLIKSASSVEQLNVVEPQAQNQFSKHVAAPKRLFRHIVGPSGTVANQIRSEFNVQLIIPNPNSKESDIKVVGEPSNVEKAIIRINEILAKHVSSY
jgi:predicted PilT family ATPase